jgi:hypothetical protein
LPTTAKERAAPPAPSGAAPPPARVPGNRWPQIDAPGLDELRPTLACSVVVSGADDRRALSQTLRALAATSYPTELVEVLAAPGPEPDAGPDAATPGAGALALRSAPTTAQAADAATGELLVFLRAGAIPAPALLAAHARWHHAVADAVSVGHSPPLGADGPDADRLADAAEDREALAARLAELPEAADEALETFLELTRGLTERRADLFLVAARHNVALRAETYRRAGGLRPGLPEALARAELAYRLDAAGAVFVPEAEARSYGGLTDGDWPLPDDSGHAPAARDPRAEALIPVGGFRPPRSGRVFERPALVVDLDVADERADEVLESVDSVLRGRFSDLRLRVSVPAAHPEADVLEQALAHDPRVEVGPEATASEPDSPYRVWLPLVAVPDERTFADLHGLIESEGVGALHVTVGSARGARERLRAAAARPRGRAGRRRRRARRATVRVAATGAAARAARVAASAGRPADAVLEELFDSRVVPGAELGLRLLGSPAPESTEYGPLAPATDLARERAEHLRQRARAHTNQARAERHAQHAVRERMRASQEKARADRMETRLARVSPGYWVRWRGRRALRRLTAVPGRVGRRAYGAARPRLVRRAVPLLDRWRRLSVRARGRLRSGS